MTEPLALRAGRSGASVPTSQSDGASGRQVIGSRIAVREAEKQYGEFYAVNRINLDIEPGEFIVLAGGSGSGKTSLLRAGCGIGVCQAHLARRDPVLVRVLPGWSMRLETWVSMHEDLRRSPRCQAAFEALASGLATLLAQA